MKEIFAYISVSRQTRIKSFSSQIGNSFKFKSVECTLVYYDDNERHLPCVAYVPQKLVLPCHTYIEKLASFLFFSSSSSSSLCMQASVSWVMEFLTCLILF